MVCSGFLCEGWTCDLLHFTDTTDDLHFGFSMFWIIVHCKCCSLFAESAFDYWHDRTVCSLLSKPIPPPACNCMWEHDSFVRRSSPAFVRYNIWEEQSTIKCEAILGPADHTQSLQPAGKKTKTRKKKKEKLCIWSPFLGLRGDSYKAQYSLQSLVTLALYLKSRPWFILYCVCVFCLRLVVVLSQVAFFTHPLAGRWRR